MKRNTRETTRQQIQRESQVWQQILDLGTAQGKHAAPSARQRNNRATDVHFECLP